ncbi:MAG TPA: AmmeMemoRadiSam system protein B, partial [Bryobacteraceae bacterium]
MPSPVEDRPGLLVRDSLRYSHTVLIIPPELIPCLTYFDGEKTDRELHEMMYRASGDLRAGEVGDQIAAALSKAGFLEDENFERLREERQQEFAESPVRVPAHAGSGYPNEAGALAEVMRRWMAGDAVVDGAGPVAGMAAPHVSPEGGFDSYRAAYARLAPELRDRTFVILGTSHYGMPDRFGLTRKSYVTPFGEARTDGALIGELVNAAPDAI